jgi:hypothetical protein
LAYVGAFLQENAPPPASGIIRQLDVLPLLLTGLGGFSPALT